MDLYIGRKYRTKNLKDKKLFMFLSPPFGPFIVICKYNGGELNSIGFPQILSFRAICFVISARDNYALQYSNYPIVAAESTGYKYYTEM